MTKKDFFNTLKGILLGLIIVAAGVTVFVYAWTGPISAPPDGNIAAPLNVSGSNQIKKGWLTIGGDNAPQQTLDVNGQIRISGGNPGVRKFLESDANGNASWALIGHQNSAQCSWVYPSLSCNVNSTYNTSYRGATCPDMQYVAGVKINRQQCPGNNNDITYTSVYCCAFSSF